jgi:hypothetical protein
MIKDLAQSSGEITIEDVKERLRAYRRACRRCDELEQRIARRRDDMAVPRAVRADSLPGGRGNSLEAAVEKIDGLERRLRADEEERDAALKDVKKLIDAVGNGKGSRDAKDILTWRYIDGVPFSAIWERLYISDRSMWRKYDRAVRAIADVLNALHSPNGEKNEE